MPETTKVAVADLNLLCNLDMGHHPTRRRPTCDKPAESVAMACIAAPVDARCGGHQGLIETAHGLQRGSVMHEVDPALVPHIRSAPPLD